MYNTLFNTLSLTSLLLPLLLSGCATPKYACGVPDGIGCKPLSEVHRMAQDGSLNSQAVADNPYAAEHDQDEKDANGADAQQTPSAASRGSMGLATVTPGTPLLIQPRIMRIWVAPWADEDGTLHDETYLYLRLDNGRWVMEQP